MTSSIPDSISMSDLESLAENAQPDVEFIKKSMSPNDMQDLVIKDVEDLTDLFENPTLGYKIVAHYSLFKLFELHNHMHGVAMDENNKESALCFARDAGWLQLMMKGLTDVHCGEGDFMAPSDN